MIRKATNRTWKQQYKFFVIGLVSLYEALVITLSLGFLTTDARAMLLFSDWIDE